MQYREKAAALLAEAIVKLVELDELTKNTTSHRLDPFQPLVARLEAIRQDLQRESGMLPASRKTFELNARMLGGFARLADPKYRSLLASLLGQYQRTGAPPKAKLGGLKGGRPRKDGKPTQTLERKGYAADSLPPTKKGKTRIHPTFEKSQRA